MSSTDKLDINSPMLGAAQGASAGAAGSGAVTAQISPPKTITTLLDAALVALSGMLTAKTKLQSQILTQAQSRQSQMFAESPPELELQDKLGGSKTSTVTGKLWEI